MSLDIKDVCHFIKKLLLDLGKNIDSKKNGITWNSGVVA